MSRLWRRKSDRYHYLITSNQIEMKREDIITAIILSSPLIVTLVFLIIKLTGLKDWSWWVVLSPIWGSLSAAVILALLYVAVLYYRIHNH